MLGRAANDLDPRRLPVIVYDAYHVLSFMTLMALLYCVISATCVSVWAPQLALRGASPVAMETAVRGIKAERHHIYASFFTGIVSFTGVVVSVAWIQVSSARRVLLRCEQRINPRMVTMRGRESDAAGDGSRDTCRTHA